MPLVVSALYDLAQRENEPRRRSVQEYLTFGRLLFASKNDLHIFCEPHLVEDLEACLTFRPDGYATRIDGLPFEDLPAWSLASRAVEGLSDGSLVRTASTSNLVKDTPSAQAVWWSKLGLMKRVVDNEQHGQHQAVWWADIGIAHACRPSESGLLELGDVEVPVFAQLASLEHVHNNQSDFFANGITCIAGGIFGIPVDQIEVIDDLFISTLNEVFNAGLFVNDEAILSSLVTQIDCVLIESTFDRLLIDIACHVDPAVASSVDVSSSVDQAGVLASGEIEIEPFVIRRVRLPDPTGEDRVALNPSIARHPDGGYFCIVRNANYQYVDGEYVRLDGSDVIRTENVLVKVNDNLEVEWSSVIDDQKLRTNPALFPVVGLEDARLVYRAGVWWMSATCREHRADGRCQIMLVQLAITHDHEVTIVEGHELPFLTPHGHEKNWMPIIGHDHAWVWGVEPTVICRFDDVTNSLVPSRTAKNDFVLRGGSQVVWWENAWLAVVHDVVRDGGQPTYRHRFVRWDADWNLLHITGPFRLGDDPHGLEFCAGLAISRDGERLMLSVGVGDERAEVIEMSAPDWLLSANG